MKKQAYQSYLLLIYPIHIPFQCKKEFSHSFFEIKDDHSFTKFLLLSFPFKKMKILLESSLTLTKD